MSYMPSFISGLFTDSTSNNFIELSEPLVDEANNVTEVLPPSINLYNVDDADDINQSDIETDLIDEIDDVSKNIEQYAEADISDKNIISRRIVVNIDMKDIEIKINRKKKLELLKPLFNTSTNKKTKYFLKSGFVDAYLGDINVYSNSSSNNKYNIEFRKYSLGLYCLCSCGVQFGCPLRKRCKHIRFIINCLIDSYLKHDKSNDYVNILTDENANIEENDKTDEIIFKLNEMSLKSLKCIFNFELESGKILSLKYDDTNKLHFGCSNSSNKLCCPEVKQGISSMIQSYKLAYTNKSNKKVIKQYQKDFKDFMY